MLFRQASHFLRFSTCQTAWNTLAVTFDLNMNLDLFTPDMLDLPVSGLSGLQRVDLGIGRLEPRHDAPNRDSVDLQVGFCAMIFFQ